MKFHRLKKIGFRFRRYVRRLQMQKSTPFRPIVFDNGTGFSKIGFAEDMSPQFIIRSIVGNEDYLDRLNQLTSKELSFKQYYIQEESIIKRKILILKYPIEQGVITNWDDMETLWKYSFENKLKISPEEHSVVLTDSIKNPKKNREKAIEIMFEKFGIQNFYIEKQPVLPMIQMKKKTGIVVDIGDSIIQIVPFFQGKIILNGVKTINLGGRDLTNYMAKILTEKGFSFITAFEREFVRDIKETLCFSSSDFDLDLKIAEEEPHQFNKEYVLPDDTSITIGNERFRCPEVLFQPYLLRIEDPGIHEQIFESIMKCDQKIRKNLFQNIILSGSSSMFPGFSDRLQKEIYQLCPENTEVKVIADSIRDISVWVGGACFALDKNNQKWISKKNYQDSGVSIVHQKCQ